MAPLLTAEEVARLLGVAPSWVSREARLGRLPHVRLGRYRRFRLATIEALDSIRSNANLSAGITPTRTRSDDGSRHRPVLWSAPTGRRSRGQRRTARRNAAGGLRPNHANKIGGGRRCRSMNQIPPRADPLGSRPCILDGGFRGSGGHDDLLLNDRAVCEQLFCSKHEALLAGHLLGTERGRLEAATEDSSHCPPGARPGGSADG